MTNHQPTLHVIIYSPFPHYSGGRENWLYNILFQLGKLGHDVAVYAYQSDRPRFYELSKLPSVKLESVNSIRAWTMPFRITNVLTLRHLALLDYFVLFPRAVIRRLARNLRDGDVVLAMNPIVDIEPALRLRRRGYKFRLVCSVRGQMAQELGEKMPWFRSTFHRLQQETLAQADCILANGYDTQAQLQALGFTSRVVPNGVDVRRFGQPVLSDPALRQVKAWNTDGVKVITSVATLRPIKGINHLLQAAKVLKETYSQPFRFLFIGKGDIVRYQLKATEMGLKDETAFIGEQSNIPGFLHFTDVLACVSGGSGMSMACLEGMAASRAIVAWDTPVYQQLIQHGDSGLLISDHNAERLAQAIETLLESSELAARLGSAAQHAAQQYDWSQVTQRLLPTLFGEK